MTIQIFICDDDPFQLNETKSLAETFLVSAAYSASYQITACSPEQLQSMLALHSFDYDIAILDIDMGDANGIDLASKINRIHPACAVIFLTSYTDYISDSYEVRHVYYVTKDTIRTYLPKALKKAVCLTLDQKNDVVEIISNREHHTLPCDKILYIERLSREVLIHMKDNSCYKVYESLLSLSERLPACFVKCHSSFIVNMAHILEISSQNICLQNTTQIPLGRRYAKDCKSAYLNYTVSHTML